MTTLFLTFGLAMAPPPAFEVHIASGPLAVGSLVRMGVDGSVVLDGDRRIAAGDFISLRRADRPVPGRPILPHLELHNGDCLAGAVRHSVDSFMIFRGDFLQASDELKPLRVPLTAVARIWLSDWRELDRDRQSGFFDSVRRKDVAVLANGDVVAGTLVAWDSRVDEVRLRNGEHERALSTSKVIAVALSTELARNRKPVGVYAKLVLTDGSRWTMTEFEIADGVLTGIDSFRNRVNISLDHVAAIDVQKGKAVYLSEVKPVELVQHSADRAVAYDVNQHGKPLQLKTGLGLATYDRGMASFGPTRLRFAIDPAVRRFECDVGLDPELGTRGHARLTIQIDGKPIALANPDLTVAGGIRRLSIDVKNGKTLDLIVEAGNGGSVGDFVNWGDARFIRD